VNHVHALVPSHDPMDNRDIFPNDVIHHDLANLCAPKLSALRQRWARIIIDIQVPVPKEEEVATLECRLHTNPIHTFSGGNVMAGGAMIHTFRITPPQWDSANQWRH
jgi:hypothetical protein